ncbi:hypothetical protein ACJX0J_021613, partial [Zea mays]
MLNLLTHFMFIFGLFYWALPMIHDEHIFLCIKNLCLLIIYVSIIILVTRYLTIWKLMHTDLLMGLITLQSSSGEENMYIITGAIGLINKLSAGERARQIQNTTPRQF